MTTDADAMTDAVADLRVARRGRVFDAMDTAELDVLVLGRRDNVAYATGASGLWTSGTRPFGAAGVLVRESRAVHLLSTWDEGIPPEVPFEHLYGVTWNPAIMGRALGAIPGLGTARRVGVDGLSVGFQRAAGRLAPDAELLPADDLLQAVRRVKLPAEVDRIRAAVQVAAAAVGAAREALAAGSSPSEALGQGLRVAADRGVTVPSSAPVVAPGCVDFGFLVDGYEGGQGRPVAPSDPTEEVQQRLLAACRTGATASDLRAAATGAPAWRVRGCGMGFEPPVITDRLGERTTLVEGMVLSVEVQVGPSRRRDLVRVRPHPETW